MYPIHYYRLGDPRSKTTGFRLDVRLPDGFIRKAVRIPNLTAHQLIAHLTPPLLYVVFHPRLRQSIVCLLLGPKVGRVERTARKSHASKYSLMAPHNKSI
jgi:hypothetical protein